MYCCSHRSREWASDQVNSVRYLVDVTVKGAHQWRRWAYYVVATMTQICSWPLLYNQSRLDGWMRWLSSGCDSLANNCLNSWCRVLRDFLQCTDKHTYFPAFLAWGKLFLDQSDAALCWRLSGIYDQWRKKVAWLYRSRIRFCPKQLYKSIGRFVFNVSV